MPRCSCFAMRGVRQDFVMICFDCAAHQKPGPKAQSWQAAQSILISRSV
jgi:hypothetical protein